MAIFGADYYGRSKYGSLRQIDFGVEPFVARPVGYNSVHLSWRDPSGSWSGFRLVRSRGGYPVNENDGVVLYESGSTAEQSFTDDDLVGGWVYYAIFLYNDVRGDWERAGTVDTLVPFDFSSTDSLWNLIPDYYKQVRANGAGVNQGLYQINPAIYLSNEQTVPNEQLISFLSVFGYSFDQLRSEVDTIRDAYNPLTVHQKRLGLLAAQFGGEIFSDVSVKNNRSLVRNLGLLYRKRGTVDGLRELLELATGWDIDVYVGKNMMLSEDQAEFVHPQVSFWDPTVRYVPGDRVRYGVPGQVNRYYAAKQVAYGVTQAPELGPNSNAYWDHDRYLNEEEQSLDALARRADTGDMSTWQIRIDGGAVIPEHTWIGMGMYDPIDNDAVNVNSLAFVNKTGSTQNVIVRSIPVRKDEISVMNRKLTIESGIPIPKNIEKWVAGTYQRGDLVRHRGLPYEANAETTDVPGTSTAWSQIGLDERVRLCFSMYVHGKFAFGSVGQGAVTGVEPYIMMFDDSGNLLLDRALPSSVTTNVVYDPFYDTAVVDAARVTPIGAKTWQYGLAPVWNAGWDDNGYFRYPAGTGRALRAVEASISDGSAALTFRRVGSREAGLVFRLSDTSNYWVATSTRLIKVVAGAAPANPASGAVSWTPFQDGDRIQVTLSGNTITVLRNGATVGSATDSFNSTATRFGIFMEA